MKNYFKIIVFLVSVFLLIGCDGYQSVEGLIIDSETNKPIENVVIKELEDYSYENKSDENGYFEISQIKGFVFGEKELTIFLSKENYLSDTITFINNEQKLIKLEKKSKSIKICQISVPNTLINAKLQAKNTFSLSNITSR